MTIKEERHGIRPDAAACLRAARSIVLRLSHGCFAALPYQSLTGAPDLHSVLRQADSRRIAVLSERDGALSERPRQDGRLLARLVDAAGNGPAGLRDGNA